MHPSILYLILKIKKISLLCHGFYYQNLINLKCEIYWKGYTFPIKNHQNRTVEYWVTRPFVAHILNANLRLMSMWFFHGFSCHTRNTGFQIKKESLKSVHPVKRFWGNQHEKNRYPPSTYRSRLKRGFMLLSFFVATKLIEPTLPRYN